MRVVSELWLAVGVRRHMDDVNLDINNGCCFCPGFGTKIRILVVVPRIRQVQTTIHVYLPILQSLRGYYNTPPPVLSAIKHG